MDTPVVELSSGTSVLGKLERVSGRDSPVKAFFGIPYAEPPVGKLRFLPTQPSKLWTGERDCTRYGSIAMQNVSMFDDFVDKYPAFPSLEQWKPVTSEDCLFLNVYTPTTASGAALPVMVWIHGGGFVVGSGCQYELTALSAYENIVCVNINYRLGVFGFLTSGDDVIPGNVGLLDQIEALKWVQRHIAAFGGDPNNVTLFGSSAGGMSASLHMVSDLSTNLFHRVICSNGIANSTFVVRTREQEVESIAPSLKELGYTGRNSKDMLEFLQSKTDKEILEAFPRYFKVVIDGHFLKDYPDNLYRCGRVQRVDMMSGYTTDEGALMIKLLKSPDITTEPCVNDVRQYVKQVADCGFSGNTDAITDAMMEIYFKDKVLSDSNSVFNILVELVSDQIFAGPSHSFLRHHCDLGNTYAFLFDYRPPPETNDPAASHAETNHVEEIPFALGFPFLLGDRAPRMTYSKDEIKLSRLLMSFFANFVRKGNPNSSDLPSWPAFTSDKRQFITLKPTPCVTQDYSPTKMDFWDKAIPVLDTSRVYKTK